MSCTINTIKKEATTITPQAVEYNFGVYIPFDETVKIKMEQFKEAREVAANTAKELNKRFNSVEFGNVANLDLSLENGVGISMTVSPQLQKAYDLRDGNITAEEYLKERENSFPDVSEVEVFEDQDYKDQERYEAIMESLDDTVSSEDFIGLDIAETEKSDLLFAAFSKAPSDVNAELSWKEKRLDLIEKLEKVRLSNYKVDRKKVKEVTAVIEDIKKELVIYDATLKNSVREAIQKEIAVLKNIISNPTIDSTQLANLFETNLVEHRLAVLKEHFFKGEERLIMQNRFNNIFNSEEFGFLANEVTKLENLYNDNLERFIYSLLNDNKIITAAVQKITDPDKLKAFQDKIKELLQNLKKYDTNKYIGDFLGDGSYNSVLAELLGLTLTINENKEKGKTSSLKAVFKNLYENIKRVEINGELLTDMLFKKDSFGVITNQLLSPFTNAFYTQISEISKSTKKFYKALAAKESTLRSDYRNMMIKKKIHGDYIKPYMISSIVKKYKNHTDFKDFFIYTEAEMQQYEKEIKQKMGETAFKLSLKEMQDNLEMFLEDETIGVRKRSNINPMNFIKHFYSANYQTYDPTTFEYILPKYTSYVPNLGTEKYHEYYTKEFRDIESAKVPQFTDFYVALAEILKYIREVHPTAGVNDILALKDLAGRAAMKDLSTKQKIYRYLKVTLSGLFPNFIEGNVENRNLDPNYDTTKDRKLESNYNSYGKNAIRELAESYSRRPLKVLLELAKKEGLTVPQNPNDSIKKSLSESIARKQVNRTSSLDLLRRVDTALNLTESYAARKASMNTANLIQEFLNKDTTQVPLSTATYIETWVNQNLLQLGFLDNSSNFAKFARQKVKIVKSLSETEEILAKVLEEEKNFTGDSYKFSFENNEYYSSKDPEAVALNIHNVYKHYKKDKQGNITEISTAEIDKKYVHYLEQRIESLGQYPIFATITKGLSDTMYSALLGLSPVTGTKNRIQGFNQNNQAAASGVRGFNTKNLLISRRFLFGTNTRRYLKPLKRLGIKGISSSKQKQINVFLKIMDSYKLLDKVYDEIVGEDTGIAKVNNFKKKAVKFLADFAMNNPEFQNQGELFLSMLQNVLIEEVQNDGSIKKVPFFNAKTGTFPLDENMKLLKKYDTEANRLNWEKGEGVDFLGFVANYKSVKNKLHGDYTGRKLGVEATVTGKTMIAMMKWSFENGANEWGYKDVNLVTAEVSVKGRKVILAEHAPVLTTHMIMMNLATGGTSLILGSPMLAVLLAGLGLFGTIFLAKKMIGQNNVNLAFAKEDWKLAGGYLLESLLKSVKSIGNASTFSKADLEFERAERFVKGIGSKNISEHDRAIISESAQQFADKTNVLFQFAVITIVTKALYSLWKVDDDDDDEMIAKKMQDFEGTFNFIVNIKNSLTADLELWSDPTKVKSLYESHVFVDYVYRSINDMVEAVDGVTKGTVSKSDAAFETYNAAGGLLLGIPRQANKMGKALLSDSFDYFSNPMIYDYSEKTYLDNILQISHLKGNLYYEKKFDQKKKLVRENLKGQFTLKLKESWVRRKRKKNDLLKDVVSREVEKFFKKEGLDKRNKRISFEQKYKNTDWDKVIEKAEAIEFK